MRRGFLLSGALLTMLLAPVTARADAGTPFLWAGLIHLTILNAVIGVVEGWALALCLRARSRRTAAWMIPANYCSAVMGVLLVGPAWVLLDHLVP